MYLRDKQVDRQVMQMPEDLYSKEHESILLQLFGRTATLRLIDFFLDNPQNDYTRIEIMEALGMAKPTIREKLPDLERFGILKMTRKIGKAKLYQLDPENSIVRCLRKIELDASTLTAGMESEDATISPILEKEELSIVRS